MNPVIETSGLGKVYGGRSAVKDLDLVVSSGASVGLLAPNGAGKSTTIKMLLGLVRPTTGSALVLGRDPVHDGAAVRAQVGYVPERHHLYEWMTVGQILRFTRAFYPTWNDRRCSELTQAFALDPDRKVAHLSQGMGTKLSLVLALAHEPELLLLDEPTTGLDPLARDEFVAAVGDLLKHFGKTVLFSSHILSDIERVADTIAIMRDGVLLTIQPRSDLIERTKRIHVRLKPTASPGKSPNGTILERTEDRMWSLTVRDFGEQIVNDIRETNAVDSLEVDDMTLEDVFLDYVKGERSA